MLRMIMTTAHFRLWTALCLLPLMLIAAAAHGQSVPDAAEQIQAPEYPLFAEALQAGSVYIVPVEGTIDNVLAHYLDRAIGDAESNGASLIIFHIDTFGGLVDAADHIRKAILNADPTTVAFIDKNAASAGALISYAADKIVMVPGSSIGAATVVEGAGGDAAPDKYQSYMRGLMRSTAEANGRDPRIAEAMVDETLEVEGVSPAGSVLTLSATEARQLGVADAVLDEMGAVIEQAGLTETQVTRHHATGTERLLRFLSSPVLQSILMLMMMGGLYFELQTPGVGFAGTIAAIGASMFFAPHYMMGLVESWELVLFGIGVLLLLAEIFVIPGFGVAGISGLVLVVGSLFAALVGNIGLQFPGAEELASAVLTMAITMVLLIVMMFSLSRYLPRSERFNQLVLSPELSSLGGFVSAESVSDLKGKLGQTITPLRPSGAAEIDGERVDVISAGDFIPADTMVEVVRVSGSRVEVRRKLLEATGETSAT